MVPGFSADGGITTMNTIWSDNIQGVMTLFLRRKLRFDDLFSEQYRKLFRLDRKTEMRILEIGCGPGALAGALQRWYPDSRITAIDRDSNFIAFAKEHYPAVDFMEGDAVALPFEDGTFDVTISNTVQEHVEPAAFWGEQYRVLKPGGICLCLSARRGIRCIAACLEMTEPEKVFWDHQPDGESELRKYQVGRYAMAESEIPAAMEKYGFGNVSAGYAVIDLTPDDPKYSPVMAEAMIEADRQNDIEAIKSARSEQEEQMISIVNGKYDKRIRLYRAGVRQWDTSVSVTMILRGEKPHE
jgi:ubiquinone/menaquinone biosynthesis C-methylase UbiE